MKNKCTEIYLSFAQFGIVFVLETGVKIRKCRGSSMLCEIHRHDNLKNLVVEENASSHLCKNLHQQKLGAEDTTLDHPAIYPCLHLFILAELIKHVW